MCFDALIFRIVNTSVSGTWKYSAEILPKRQPPCGTWAFSCGPYSPSEEPEVGESEGLGQGLGRNGGVAGF